MKNRDDFPKKVVDPLKARVNNRCSNPICRVPTTGPTTDHEKVNNIGIAAHITAASPGGPRYDPFMSKEERKSIKNAIWLCSNCSIKIDRDPNKYSVNDLLSWKESAEKKASEELGKKLPDDNYVIQSLATALTGQSSIFLPNLLSNASKATSMSLETLDPRFFIKTNYCNGLTSFELRAKEPVDTQIFVNKKFTDEFIEKYTKLKEHGEKLVIDSQAVEIKGSPLLREIFSQQGRLEVTQNLNKKTIQKLWVEHPTTPENIQFYDIVGSVAIGTNSMTFDGSTCDNIFSINYRINHHQFGKSNINFTFSINFKIWDDKDIVSLPYFDSIYELMNKINEGWILHSSMEIEGKKLFAGTVNNIQENEYFKSAHSQLHYIKIISGICQKLNISIKYNHAYEYTADEHRRATEVYQIMSDGISVGKISINDNAKCTLEATDDLSNIRMILDAKDKPAAIRIEQLEQETITPFSQAVLLPKFNHTLSEVTPIIKTDISNLKPGDLVEVEWVPTEDCKYTIDTV
jgi:hypothetical protein